MIRVGVVGGTGKLGKDIIGLLSGHGDMEAAAVVTRKGNPYAGKDISALTGGGEETGRRITEDIRETFGLCDVYIDCTNAEVFRENAGAYLEVRKPVILATTGFDDEGEKQIRALSRLVPVVVAPNLSIGVYRFLQLVRTAAQLLDAGVDIDIVEAHHKGKKDSPSGTANRLKEIIGEERRRKTGAEAEREISVHSIRAGAIVGEHTVQFISGDNERITLSHAIESRTAFAEGAVRAVKWIMGQDQGLYGPEDVFGIERS